MSECKFYSGSLERRKVWKMETEIAFHVCRVQWSFRLRFCMRLFSSERQIFYEFPFGIEKHGRDGGI